MLLYEGLKYTVHPLAFVGVGQKILSGAWREHKVDTDREHVVQNSRLFAGRYQPSAWLPF